MKKFLSRNDVILLSIAILAIIPCDLFAAAADIKNSAFMEFSLKQVENPDEFVPALKILSLLTILSIAPAILLMMTSFTRILIVLGFVRHALGTQTMPPNQVIVGLSLFLTFFTMSPMLGKIEEKAITPYIEKQIDQKEALTNILEPIRSFMMKETRQEDLSLFLNISNSPKPETEADIPFSVLMPSFMISELKTAFQIGFLIYIPFLIIDMVISSVLMAMGMMMLPPTVVSLPFKLILFILVDGWTLIISSLVKSFQIFGG
ncbi:MAG: flagellar type III secretion system pore protein FliP [Oligoflexales bacterium]|nr:flagellar type III secretion system pore protein FliP [Oligoflexales bacterium]